ncbi:hypothetical protein Syun_023303 [Stephania yunnanensis]|uniref:Uncharacterized protein n=1 Tax=Stephania yunnanensis TaxID=152371 RepID=A0AAP0I263_9MAGN
MTSYRKSKELGWVKGANEVSGLPDEASVAPRSEVAGKELAIRTSQMNAVERSSSKSIEESKEKTTQQEDIKEEEGDESESGDDEESGEEGKEEEDDDDDEVEVEVVAKRPIAKGYSKTFGEAFANVLGGFGMDKRSNRGCCPILVFTRLMVGRVPYCREERSSHED